MTPSIPLTVAASYPAQNSLRSRGHVIVLPGRGESAGLYQRLGERIAYDGYTVSVVALPELSAIDGEWLDRVVLWPGAHDAGEITVIGSDSGAALAVHLADRLGIGAAVLAGFGGLDRVAEPATGSGDGDARLSARSACPLYLGRLTDGSADLAAPAAQQFGQEAAARLATAVLTVPVLAVHGREDPIAPLDQAVRHYRSVAADAEIVTVAGGLHDILNDVAHRSVAARIVQFLEGRGEPVLEPVALEPVLWEQAA